MNVLIVDTSSWISYFKGTCVANDEIELALKESRVYMTPIVASELLSATKTTKNQNKLIEFIEELALTKNDLEHWLNVGKLRSKLLRQGVTISTPDAHICQATLDLDGYLLSEDKIFQKISSKVKLKLL